MSGIKKVSNLLTYHAALLAAPSRPSFVELPMGYWAALKKKTLEND